jgi:hypothetical protein
LLRHCRSCLRARLAEDGARLGAGYPDPSLGRQFNVMPNGRRLSGFAEHGFT